MSKIDQLISANVDPDAFDKFTLKEYEQIQKQKDRNDERNKLFESELDITKCASCKCTFTEKRFKCSGCSKVAYCDAKCQRKHWKDQHKQDCNFFKTLNTGPQ